MKKIKWKKVGILDVEYEVGTLLKTKDGKIILVGDVNKVMGVCDDCLYRGIVVKYCDDFVEEFKTIKGEKNEKTI